MNPITPWLRWDSARYSSQSPTSLIRALGIFAALTVASAASAATVGLNGHQFTLPDGFEIELVAGPPLVDRPITADFDEQGRLYVADSSGSNDSVREQLEKKPHRIVRLEDTDGDGRFDRRTMFADRMMFPEGTLWHDGSLYVGAPPAIWKLTDTTGDGVADRREEWFDAKTLTGCANDLHGPYLGPDGWIYWCKGAFAEQTHTRPDGSTFTTKAAHIFRRHPERGGVEAVMTGGMDNPVDVVFTPEGERIFTTTFFQHPGGGRRDGLVHAIYGGVYGKVHHVIEDHLRTGDVMPVLTHLGPAAPCGLARYESSAFGREFQNNLFACLFNLHKVTRHVLHPRGASFQTADEDFLVSDQVDFHPTDVVEDADGSLLVVDTGGWYKICCPTSQLYKPDVLGAIYRIRRSGAAFHDPRGSELDWAEMDAAELAGLLGDERPQVRRRAMSRLAEMGESGVPALERALANGASILIRQNALWTLMRVPLPQARSVSRSALTDQDAEVRHVAAYAAGLWRDREAAAPLMDCLNLEPPLQRAAAEALGRISDPAAVPALLQAAAHMAEDRILEHSIIYALIEIGDPESTRKGLAATSPRAQRAALIALDQMKDGELNPATLAPLLASENPVLQETASWLMGRHPEWAGALTEFLLARFQNEELTSAQRDEVERQLGRYAQEESVRQSLARWSDTSAASRQIRLSALRAMAYANLEGLPRRWAESLAAAVLDPDPELSRQAILTARVWADAKSPDDELNQALAKVGANENLAAATRIQALAAVGGGLKDADESIVHLLQDHIQPTHPVAVRRDAALVLSKAALDDSQLLSLAEALPSAGPLEIPILLAAFHRTKDETVCSSLLSSLQSCGRRHGLRAEILQPHFEKFPASLRDQAVAWLATLNVDAAEQKSRLDALLEELKDGDIRRGQAVFNSERAACASCHAIGYLGGDLGPDLTRIGQIRTERDLLEAIVYPSASFVRSYEPIVVVTESEEEYSGVLRGEASDAVILATGPGVETRIARADVVEMRPGRVSVMPGGLDEQLSKQELADLVAFLKATRW